MNCVDGTEICIVGDMSCDLFYSYNMCIVVLDSIYILLFCVFFFKQKTAYEMRISDWSSDVCSSDLGQAEVRLDRLGQDVDDLPVEEIEDIDDQQDPQH